MQQGRRARAPIVINRTHHRTGAHDLLHFGGDAAQFLRVIGLPGAIGNGVIWTFGPNELVIGQVLGSAAAVTSLVVWNLSTNSAATDIYFVVDE